VLFESILRPEDPQNGFHTASVEPCRLSEEGRMAGVGRAKPGVQGGRGELLKRVVS